jgi:hypothetical protein
METDDRIRLGFEHWAKSQGFDCASVSGRYTRPVVRWMALAWRTQAEKISDLHAALARSTERNARLSRQCRDHDTRRAAAVAQCAAMAEEIERLNATITALTRESRDAQEM